jgi:FixJ family two-component response regulator
MSVIWLVDDDAAILRGLERLLGAEGFETRSHLDAATFLAAHDPALPGCAVIDLGLQTTSGLALQDKLANCGTGRPVIFLTGQGTIPSAVQAMRAGAVDFLTKPVEAETLLTVIRRAIDLDLARRADLAAQDGLRRRLSTLTPREHEVMQELLTGQLNKQIAFRLGAAEKTVKVHRGRVMHKMGVRSVAELVTLMSRLQDAPQT